MFFYFMIYGGVRVAGVNRGIHPLTHKQALSVLWADSPIQIMPAPEKVYIPVSQHIGKPAQPVVVKGQYVKMGELIAQSQGGVSSNIHSSVSGKVLEIAKCSTVTGALADCIIIDNDNNYEPFPSKGLTDPDPDEIKAAVLNGGVVGMGGATFPAHVKLNSPVKIDILIVNGAECEPYITSDNRLMIESANTIIQGALYAARAAGAEKIIVGIEANKPQAINVMTNAAARYANIEVRVLPKRYPMGAEKQLIYHLTKRIVPSGSLPSQVGCIVQNVATCDAIFYAVTQGKPVTRRIVTVAGSAVKKGVNLEIALGTRMIDVLTYLDIEPVLVSKVISGGPMMGISVADLNTPVTKGTSCLLLLNEKDSSIPEESPCIRCGRCVQVCPMGLVPTTIDALSRIKDLEGCEKWHAQDCIECGSCTFVCPAKRYLMQSLRMAKAAVLAKRREGK